MNADCSYFSSEKGYSGDSFRQDVTNNHEEYVDCFVNHESDEQF